MNHKPHERIMSALTTQPWMISEEGLLQMIAIASHEGDIDAVKSQLEQRHPDSFQATIRGDVGVVPLSGPIFPKANLMTEMSGATALSQFAIDFQTMLDDESVNSIVLDVRSPGGVVDGINEMAHMIYNARGQGKKIVGYCGSTAASAAYWLIAACDEIVIDATSRLGSIGVVAGIRPKKEGDPIEFTNTASPNKRYDAETKEGKAILLEELDALADVFIGSVAQFRSVDEKKVRKDFGKGGMLVGQSAIDAGMADRLGSYEEIIRELNGSPQRKGEKEMDFAAMKKEDLLANRSDLVVAIQEDATAPLIASHQQALEESNTTIAGLQADNEALVADNKAKDDRIATFERADAVRAEKDIAIEATGIVDSALSASSIPERLHNKVRAGLSHEGFVADGKLDAEGYKAHVAEDVKGWQDDLGTGDAPIQGVGARSDNKGEASDVDAAEEDAIVNRMCGGDEA